MVLPAPSVRASVRSSIRRIYFNFALQQRNNTLTRRVSEAGVRILCRFREERPRVRRKRNDVISRQASRADDSHPSLLENTVVRRERERERDY